MIQSKEDLAFFLAADKFSLGKHYPRPRYYDFNWKFQILLRRLEYYSNMTNKSLFRTLALKYYKYRKTRLGLKLGFDIPINVFGAGLKINHFGNIVINGNTRIGMWCDIHQGVNIGSDLSADGRTLVPTIGNNVWIGPGVKLFGDISVGNQSIIGANAVVNSSHTDGQTLAGAPAKAVRNTGTESISCAASPERMRKFFQENPSFRRYQPND